MTAPLYEVGVIAVDGDDRVGEFTGCIQKLVADTVGGTTLARLAVNPVEDMQLKGPAVALVLWDESLTEGHLESLARLHASDITVIPVVNSLETMPHLLAGLADLNAVGWDKGSTPIARMCLRELGPAHSWTTCTQSSSTQRSTESLVGQAHPADRYRWAPTTTSRDGRRKTPAPCVAILLMS